MKTRERIDLSSIDDNPWQPRQEIDQEGLQEIADSIHQLGLLQAPLGRRHPEVSGRIQLAFGHRRVAGCRLLHQQGRGEPHIEMDVAGISDEGMAVLALTENERRKQLSQIEVVRAHQRAIEETELTTQSLADQLGMPRPTLANNLRVLDLPDFVLEHVESGALGLTVAREFLVLQNGDHAHVEDMQDVVREIVGTHGRRGAPDWSRRHVRRLIAARVSYNEADFRPLGPRPIHHHSGAAREATFDTATFAQQLPDTLHTIPAANSLDDHYELQCDSSRVWTCAVKEWRLRQTRATREATKEAEATGEPAPAASSKSVSRDKQLEQLLAKDPVFKQVVAARAKKGPNRPVDDNERAQLGTRAELREVGHDEAFWKITQRVNAGDRYEWSRLKGGGVPPWFPDIEECQGCTIGAAYARSRGGYPLRDATLVCFNQKHYQEKLSAGEIAYRGKLEAQRKGVDRQDAKAVKRLMRQLEPLSEGACQALASSLVAAQPTLLWVNPIGFYDKDWSHESWVVSLVRDLLGSESLTNNGRWEAYGSVVDVDAVASLAPEDLRKLAAALMTHHLRLAGKIDTVSRETVATTATEEA